MKKKKLILFICYSLCEIKDIQFSLTWVVNSFVLFSIWFTSLRSLIVFGGSLLTETGQRIIEKILTKLLPFVWIWEERLAQDLRLIYWVTVQNTLHLNIKPMADSKNQSEPLLKAIKACRMMLETHPALDFLNIVDGD